MAQILRIIPKGCRTLKKAKILNRLKDNTNNIQKRLDLAKQTKIKLDIELSARNINLKRSMEAANKLDTVG